MLWKEKFNLKHLLNKFNDFYPDNKNELKLFFAPGRINLIGEHTDYTGGYVLPAAIDKGTYILCKKNQTNKINISSLNFSDNIEKIDLTKELEKLNRWTDYVKGIIIELRKLFEDINSGFDALVYGNIPDGAGLSSSASFELVLILTILSINNKDIPLPGTRAMIDYCLLAQRCENNFVGINCGIMDQFIIGNGKKDNAIKLDCSDLVYEYVNLDLDKWAILVINTNKKRKLEESQYNQRRKECEEGFNLLKQLGINKKSLGKVSIEEWNSVKDQIKDKIIKKRLNHVITENYRVLESQKKLEQKDIMGFANLLNESGISLRDDFEVTGFHLDSLVTAAKTTEGVIASRMMGGGFGGCTINIVDKNLVQDIMKEIEKKYLKETNIEPDFYLFNISDGAKQLEVKL